MVITPTTGKDTMVKAMQSVIDQTIPTEHLIVVDGEESYERMGSLVTPMGKKITRIQLPENVGGNGWYGHRVYAAMPLMVDRKSVV